MALKEDMKVGGTHRNALSARGCMRTAKSARAKKDSASHRLLSIGSDLAKRMSAQDTECRT